MDKKYGPIHEGFGNPFARDYTLDGCLRCGAAIPANKAFRDQHNAWHEYNEQRFVTVDSNFTLIQDNLNKVWDKINELVNWLNDFRRRNS